jgi:nitric oxide reductase subunit B
MERIKTNGAHSKVLDNSGQFCPELLYLPTTCCFMKKRNFITYLLNPKNWWFPLLLIFTVSIAGVTMIGVHTYTEAPPIPNYVSSAGQNVFTKEDILKGQAVFQKYALMEYGSMFGDGANRGPDFTAEALHQVSSYMHNYYDSKLTNENELTKQGITEQVKKEIKNNLYQKQNNSVLLSDAQAFAANELKKYYLNKFTNPATEGAFKPSGYLTNESEINSFTAFAFWGAWVCGVERPGKNYSYTHNWPYDPAAGNLPSAAVIFWSMIG